MNRRRTARLLSAMGCVAAMLSLPASGRGASFTILPDFGYQDVLKLAPDGKSVIGVAQGEVFRWSPATGRIVINQLSGAPANFVAEDVTPDGATVGGRTVNISRDKQTYRWTLAGGFENLGHAAGEYNAPYLWWPAYVSRDGSVVAGHVRPQETTDDQAFRWTEAGGIEYPVAEFGMVMSANGEWLAGLTNDFPAQAFVWNEHAGVRYIGAVSEELKVAEPRGFSADGNVLVGKVGSVPFSNGVNDRAFRWTTADGLQTLGELGGRSESRGASADGSVIIGTYSHRDQPFGLYNERTFVWNAKGGMQPLRDLLASQGIMMEPVTYPGPNNDDLPLGISDDGQVILGVTRRLEPQTPVPRQYYWIANFAVPEPTAGSIAVTIIAMAIAIGRRANQRP